MFAVKFIDPEGSESEATFYAGKTKDNSLGFAPTLRTAIITETREEAGRWAANGYGSLAKLAHVIEVRMGLDGPEEVEVDGS